MALMLSEGVRSPDELDPYAKSQKVPAEQLVTFMGKWQVHRKALDNFHGFVDAAKAAGVGIVPIPGAASAYRPIAQQEQLFLSRYTTSPVSNSKKTWNGRVYYLKPGMAQAAVPGNSMHGLGLAIDFCREGGRAINAAERAKLVEIGRPFAVAATVKSENWHFACQNADMVAGHPVTSAPAPSAAQNDDAKILVEAAQMPVLALGSASLHVAYAQNVLREKVGQREVVTTGNFDAVTEQAVRNMQAWYKLTVTGVVDSGDWFTLLKIDRGLL